MWRSEPDFRLPEEDGLDCPLPPDDEGLDCPLPPDDEGLDCPLPPEDEGFDCLLLPVERPVRIVSLLNHVDLRQVWIAIVFLLLQRLSLVHH